MLTLSIKKYITNLNLGRIFTTPQSEIRVISPKKIYKKEMSNCYKSELPGLVPLLFFSLKSLPIKKRETNSTNNTHIYFLYNKKTNDNGCLCVMLNSLFPSASLHSGPFSDKIIKEESIQKQ